MSLVLEERCPQNHACPLINICPVDALSQKGFAAPQIDEQKCIDCGACIDFCPYRAVVENSGHERVKQTHPS